jgi:hypothetical protein
MILDYALFHDGKYYRVRDVDGFLRLMRGDADFREALIEQLKSYCYVSDKIDELAEAGKLEVTGEPGRDEKMDEMTRNFALLVKKEFSKEWNKLKIVKEE